MFRTLLVRTSIALVAVATLSFCLDTAVAATIVKANNTTSLGVSTSWVGGVIPGILDVAQWDPTVTGSNATTLGAGFYLGEISILNPGGPVTVNADGNTLSLYGINGMGIDMSSATQNLTLNCPILLGSTQTWNVASGQALTVGGVVGGSFGLNLAGGGSTVLTGNNTFTGPVTVNGGAVTMTGNNVYTGSTTISGGTLQLGGAGVLGSGNYAGTIANNGALVISASGNQTLAGVISGSGALYQLGSGITTLTSANTYTGPTTAAGGQLILFNATTYNSPTTINSGARLSWNGNANLENDNKADTIALLSGGTLENLNPENWTVILGPVTASGTTTINQTGNAASSGIEGFFLDGGLNGSGTLTVNAANTGSGVNFRNNKSTFSGTLIVNGIASTTPFAGSGIGVGGCTTGLQNADITLNGTMELLNQGIGWANTASGRFTMGALSGTGAVVGNFTSGGATTFTLGYTNNNGSFSGVIANGTAAAGAAPASPRPAPRPPRRAWPCYTYLEETLWPSAKF